MNFSSAGFSLGFGEILVIFASFCNVIASIISKKVMAYIDPVKLTGSSQLFGGVFLVALGLMLGGSITHLSLFAILRLFIYARLQLRLTLYGISFY